MSYNIPIYVGYKRLDKFKRKLNDEERNKIRKKVKALLQSEIDNIAK
jgi:hypothetical protein